MNPDKNLGTHKIVNNVDRHYNREIDAKTSAIFGKVLSGNYYQMH